MKIGRTKSGMGNIMENSASYRNIFKTTFLFGFVKVFNILVKIGLQKAVAVLLGASGLGTIGLFNNAIQFIRQMAGLGIDQSAVRDISEANGNNRIARCSEVIAVVKRVIGLTCLLGIILTLVFSRFLSRYTFGNYSYTVSYIFLSIAVGATILTAGQSAILTGMRRLRHLAYSSMIGAIVGLLSGLPFYYFLGDKGIVPSLIVSNLTQLLVTGYYVNRLPVERFRLSVKKFVHGASAIVKTGAALMIQGLMLQVSNLIIASYISLHDNLSVLGCYQAGIAIIGGYFGVILTAMTTEYYPRISAINSDNPNLNNAVNVQSETGLMLAFPLVILFVIFSDFFFRFLYSEEFMAGTDYVNFAVMGTVTIICSNCMGMVLMAKQKYKTILISSFIMSVIILTINIVFYRLCGLKGLGCGYFFSGLLQFVVYDRMMFRRYRIRFNCTVLLKWLLLIVAILVVNFMKYVPDVRISYTVNAIILLCATLYTLHFMRHKMNISFSTITYYIKNKFHYDNKNKTV